MPELQSRVDLIWIWSSINGFAAIACTCGLANTKMVGRLGSPRNMEEAMKKLCQGGHLLPELGSRGWPCGMWCHCSTCHKHLLCTEFLVIPSCQFKQGHPSRISWQKFLQACPQEGARDCNDAPLHVYLGQLTIECGNSKTVYDEFGRLKNAEIQQAIRKKFQICRCQNVSSTSSIVKKGSSTLNKQTSAFYIQQHDVSWWML